MSDTSFQVIGLSGFAGSGKDYVYQQTLWPHGWRQFSLAWHFKTFLIGAGIITYEEAYKNPKPERVRHLLQIQGTELGRELYGDTIWLRTAKVWMQTLSQTWGVNKFVIPDVRFWNELNFIKDELNGIVIRISAPERAKKSGLTLEQRIHPSEAEMAEMTDNDFDGIIDNNPGAMPDIVIQMNNILSFHGWDL